MADGFAEGWAAPTGEGVYAFRRALGQFATGVTVVATRQHNGENRAFTANSFTSVSLDPALVLVCIAKSSASLDIFREAQTYSINILGENQRDISNAFASRDPDAKIAAAGKLKQFGAPYVEGSLATIQCDRHDVVDAGDHLILIGRATHFAMRDGEPLGFFRGNYVGIGAGVKQIEQAHSSMIVGGILEQDGAIVLCRRRGAGEWTIPGARLVRGERHAAALQKQFGKLGVEIGMTIPFSLFQEHGEEDTTLFFTVEAMSPVTPGLLADGSEVALFTFDDAPWSKVSGVMKKAMLERYLREARNGLHGVYFDSLDGGSVLPLTGRPHRWSDWNGAVSSPREDASAGLA